MINLNGTTTGYGANTAELANVDIRLGNSAVPINGIYSPGANQLAISTAGTGRLLVDAGGAVQITSITPYNLGATPPQLYVLNSSATRSYNLSSSTELAIERSTTCYASIIGGSSSVLQFGDASSENPGRLVYDHGNDSLSIYTASTESARVDSSGRLLVGTSTDSGGALLQVNGDRIRVGSSKTPASASATGTAGEICWDASYIYVCTATNTWKRAAIASW